MINFAPPRPAVVPLAPVRTVLALAAAGTLTIGLAPVASATAGAPSPIGPAKVLSTRQATDAKTYIYPLAAVPKSATGSAALALFERYNAVGRSLDPTGILIAVDAAGRSSKVGVVTPDMRDFSIVGGNLRASAAADSRKVYAWSIPGRPHQTYTTATLRTGHRYLGATPTGWLSIDAAGQLYDDDGTAAPQPLANPFGTAQDVGAVSGPTGAVVWNAAAIVFVEFASGEVTPLDTSELTDLPGGTNTPTCWSASAKAVACGSNYFTGEDDSGLRNVFLDPLDGSPAYAVNADRPNPATMLGRKAAWLTNRGNLRVMGEGSLVTSSDDIGTWPVAGLGGFLATSPSRHAGIQVDTAARHTRTVLPATKATTEVTGFALTDGAVIWVTNDKGAAAGALHRRTLSRNASHTGVTADAARKIADTNALRGTLTAAGKTIAYPTDLNNSAVGQNGGETLRVVTPHGKVTIRGVDRYLPVSLGAGRVAYYTGERSARLYNLKTGKTTKLAVTGIALSGHWLAYADTAGTIRLKNLRSGAVRTVATGVQIVGDQLFVRGQVVAWNAYPAEFGGHLGFYRDLAGNAGVVQLPTDVNVWQLSDAGIVLEHTAAGPDATSPAFPGARALRFHPAMTFSLQPYDDGAAATLLVADYPVAGPQVAGNIVAWIDQHGRLRARALG
jgi:hypothetical protein